MPKKMNPRIIILKLKKPYFGLFWPKNIKTRSPQKKQIILVLRLYACFCTVVLLSKNSGKFYTSISHKTLKLHFWPIGSPFWHKNPK